MENWGSLPIFSFLFNGSLAALNFTRRPWFLAPLIVPSRSTNITGEHELILRYSPANGSFRGAGYILLIYILVVVSAATHTAFNEDVLHIKFWEIVVTSILVLIGVVPRIKKHKLGF